MFFSCLRNEFPEQQQEEVQATQQQQQQQTQHYQTDKTITAKDRHKRVR